MNTIPVAIATPRGAPLSGLLYGDAARATTAVVFCHGFLGTQDTLAPRCAELLVEASDDVAVLTFDYAGFGQSPGPAHRVDPFAQVEDVAAAVRAMLHHAPNAAAVGLLGISFGSGIALQAAALDPYVAAAVSLSTYRTGEEWLRDMRPLHQMLALRRKVEAVRRGGADAVATSIPLPEIFPRDPIGAAYEQNLRDDGAKRATALDAISVEQILRFRPIDHARALRPKQVRLVHCEDDVTMWIDHARDFAVRAHAELEVIHDVDHYAVYQPAHFEPLCDRVARFFVQALGPKN